MSQTMLHTRCCIAGGGPAGMMLGLLLARAGVEVVVLEKHTDFLRDFRGDTIHPSTLEVVYELGLLDDFLSRPHQEVRQLRGQVGETELTVADFTHLPTHCKFLAFMPQWDFLDFLAEHARACPTFRLQMNARVTELLWEGERVAGVKAETPDGPLEVRAPLTVGADGRHSTVRELARLPVANVGAPIDVLWTRVSRLPSEPDLPLGRFDRGRILVTLYRGDYWQLAFVIPKGGYDDIRRRGLEAFRDEIADAAPSLRDRLGELRTWDDVKLLTVAVDRLRQWWKPGVLCVGDAAHAMSPVGGVGINLAIQDAVATANRLAAPLRTGAVTDADLHSIQRRRKLPTQVTQAFQMLVQNRVIRSVLATRRRLPAPWPVRMIARFPGLARLPARLIGLGVRPEHVRTAQSSTE